MSAEVASAGPSPAPQVRSEVGRLRTVLMHRPGLELRRVTPSNMEELLFDELLWVDRAQAEHDAFAQLLRGAGVEVLLLGELLAEVLRDATLAEAVVTRHVTEQQCGPSLVGAVREHLLGLEVAAMVDHLVGGVTIEEVRGGAAAEVRGRASAGRPAAETPGGVGLVARAHQPWAHLLPPLPNAVFTRDSSAWVAEGAVIAPMNRLVRRRESDLLRLVYAHHPRFAGAPVWFGAERGEHFPATVEGGDILVVAEDGLAVGLSERTTPSGVELLAARLFEADAIERVLAVELPQQRATMHLDTVVTMVDRATFLVYPRLRAQVRCLRVTRGAGGAVEVTDGGELRSELAWAAGVDEAVAIEPALGSVEADREQWSDGNNVLAIAPGEVIAYERNVVTNEVLAEAGVTVRTIPSDELPRGRGGPRCMSCPVVRDPA